LIDTSGHGVGAALLAISILNLLRSQSFGKDKLYKPDEIMAELNRAFQMSRHNGRYFTMWYGVFKRSQRKLTYASAGHPNGLLIIDGQGTNPEIKKLPSLDIPIGFFPDMEYSCAEVSIPLNSKLYIFSDGVFEVMQENEKIWGMPKFINFLSENFLEAEAINANSILEEIRRESPTAKFDDDVSLLQIHF
jgi:sigma-B regulation protein RsbU (phosphoserine phosphatase)